MELASQTARIKQSFVYDRDGNILEEKKDIKIIDINALLQTIEKSK